MMDKTSYPWLLSKVLERNLIRTKEEVNIFQRAQMFVDFRRSCRTVTNIRTGSFGDGFVHLHSDIDNMYIDNAGIVMYNDTKHQLGASSRNHTNMIIRKGSCSPGYVNLQLCQHENILLLNERIKCALVPVGGSYFLSSDFLREDIYDVFSSQVNEVVSVGPSNKVIDEGTTEDVVGGFLCCNWPHDAHEWIGRTRVYGWPSKSMVDAIVKMGCHVVPVGDKCSEDTLVQWRISFALAERYLAHSLSFTQFKVYGLLKYLLRQMKDRIEHDTGDGDLLCSYFIKTVIFYAVENSPQSLWQEKNIFVCFHFCLTMLTDWVQSGYCPNYFIKTNNMFRRKVHGVNKIKLLDILYEVKDMKWKSLSVGSAFFPSIWTLINDPEVQAQLTKCETPIVKEYKRDYALFMSIGKLELTQLDLILVMGKLMGKLLNVKSKIDEAYAYAEIVRLLVCLSIQGIQKDTAFGENKDTYRYQRKYKHWLSFSLGTQKLYLATFYYHTGCYRKAIELCENAISSIYMHQGIASNLRYRDTFCGKGFSFIDKLKCAFSANMTFKSDNLHFCIPDLYMEVNSQRSSRLQIPPLPYALFLSFMCHHNTGNTKEQERTLNDLLAVKYDEDQGGHKYWIVHTLIGICYQTKGDYQNAIRSFEDSLTVKPDKNPAKERIRALESATARKLISI